MKQIKDLSIKLFADGADKQEMLVMNEKDHIKGLTTNPTLMRKAGIENYKSFCTDILSYIKNKPLSFEVFSDDLFQMERQANEIASWGENVYVKLPITNTQGQSCCQLAHKLSHAGIKINLTAIMTLQQVRESVMALSQEVPSYISVFAGRIADTGVDPLPIMSASIELLKLSPKAELIWASPRELLNIFQADEIGCHIITVTNDILKKLNLVGYSLESYSLDTVKMFYQDAKNAGYEI